MYGTIFICCSPASQTDHPMGLYCVNGGASHEYEDAAAPTPPSTSSAGVDRQVINGYELCKVEFPGGCADHEEPQAAAAEYCQSTFGDDWLPIGDHGGSCNNCYCIDAHIDLGHQAFNDCNAATRGLFQDSRCLFQDSGCLFQDSECLFQDSSGHHFEGGVSSKELSRARHHKSIASHH